MSSTLARSNPGLAAQLSPFPIQAYERQAVTSLVLDENQTTIDLANSLEPARRAFASGGISTEAAAILAFAQEEPEQRAASLAAAESLSLRGRILNFTVAQAAAERGDTQTSLAALDRLLTLYSNVRVQLIPAMVAYLDDAENIPALQQVLQGDPEWADEFFSRGSRDPETLQNLGRLRISMADTLSIRPGTDRGLVRQLVQADHWDEAFTLYSLFESNMASVPAETEGLGWGDQFPPFDWALADERDFHARPDASYAKVDVRIDSGRGGQLAQRLAPRPEAGGTLLIEHSLEPASSLGDMRVSVTCAQSEEVLGESPLSASPMRLPLGENPCQWVEIVIVGRAFSGRPGIAGEIGTIGFVD